MHDDGARRAKLLEITGANVRKLDAVVKWFNPLDDFGFVADSDLGDVFLHGSVSRCAGVSDLPDGAKIQCEAVEKVRGKWAVTRIYHVDTSGCQPKCIPDGTWHHGMVKWFNRPRGFGFIACLDFDEEVFLHMDAVRASGTRYPRPAEEVQFMLDQDAKGGLRAAYIRGLQE
jgi:CspA family cold shock protein